MGGLFITFEGPEGVGKSTHIGLLKDSLKEAGRSCVQSREPGGTALGESIRNLLQHAPEGESMCDETELLLFSACRAQLVSEVIKPALARGEMVLCDRFYDSTVAYQGYGRGLDLATIQRLRDVAVQAVHPDLTILMDMPAEVSMDRVNERSGGKGDRIEQETIEFHRRVREGFLKQASEYSDRFMVVDAEDSIETNRSKIWAEVNERLQR